MKKENWSLVFYHGVLQMLTMLTATVLIGQLAGISLPVTLFSTGLGCIIFTLITKGRVPIGLGLSGSWLGTMIAMSEIGLDHVVGVTILGGMFYALFALLIKFQPKILKLFTPYILTLAVMMIAFNLIGTGVGLVMAAPITGIVTIVAIALANQFKLTKTFAFPLGILAGTVVHGSLYGLTSTFSGTFVPNFVVPAFNSTTLAASLIFFALATEALGDSKLAADVTGNKYEPDKVIMGNGIASIVAGLFGGMSVTTYSESCGYVRATGYANPKAIIVAGLLYIGMSFIPGVSHVIGYIPGAALAGMLLYLFSLVAMCKIDEAKASDESEMLVGIIGLAAFFLAPSLIPSISQIAIGMIAMIVTHLALQGIKKLKK